MKVKLGSASSGLGSLDLHFLDRLVFRADSDLKLWLGHRYSDFTWTQAHTHVIWAGQGLVDYPDLLENHKYTWGVHAFIGQMRVGEAYPSPVPFVIGRTFYMWIKPAVLKIGPRLGLFVIYITIYALDMQSWFRSSWPIQLNGQKFRPASNQKALKECPPSPRRTGLDGAVWPGPCHLEHPLICLLIGLILPLSMGWTGPGRGLFEPGLQHMQEAKAF